MDIMNFDNISCSAHAKHPIDTIFGEIIDKEKNKIIVPLRHPVIGEWGKSVCTYVDKENTIKFPISINFDIISIQERKGYNISGNFDKGKNIKPYSGYELVLGLAPYGLLSVWISSLTKSYLLGSSRGMEKEISLKTIYPSKPDADINEYCNYLINRYKIVDAVAEGIMPTKDTFESYMKQFSYRYHIALEKWVENDNNGEWQQYTDNEDEEVRAEFDWIEEALYDGTHDKLRDGGLLKYHEAGKPKKLAVQFHQGKSEYTAYFWFDETGIREVFDRFYGAHPETKTDFIIRIDPEKKKYELAIFRYGLKEPVIIREDAYQFIVFKNQFEDHRSENYNQPRGAWIW